MNVIFMGTPDFAVPVLDAIKNAGHTVKLVVTQPDKPRGRGKKGSRAEYTGISAGEDQES